MGYRTRSVWSVAAALLMWPMTDGLSRTPPDGSRQSTGLVGVIGHWTESRDAIITVDGTKWTGQTPSTALARASERLFGGPTEAFVRSGSAPGAFPLAVATSVRQFTSGTLRVQFRLIGGASDQNAGIVFNLSPAGEYLYARYNTKDGDLALWRFVNGERQLIVHGTGASQLPLNAWHELVVTIRGRELAVSIANNRVLALAHTLDAEPSGRVGLWVKRDAVTAFRNFSATAEP